MLKSTSKHVGGVALAILLLPSLFFARISHAQNQLLLGESQAYGVVFRGNGEAVVSARFVISNSTGQPLTNFTFTIPKVNPYQLTILQQVLPPACAEYNYQSSTCRQYTDPDYSNSYYYYGYGYNSGQQTQYQPIQYSQSGSSYTLALPTPIAPYKSGAVIVSYAAQGYVSSFLGLFTFNFETIKVSDRIQDLHIAIDVDSDLYLKGGTSQVNYQSAPSAELNSIQGVSLSNPLLDKTVGSIGQGGRVIKEAKALAPNESYTATGEYATSWWRLYLSSIVWTIIIIAAIFVAIWWLKKWLHKKQAASMVMTPTNSDTQSTGQAHIAIFDITNAGFGLLSAALVVGLSYALISISSWGILNSYYGYNPVIELMIPIVILFLYVLLIFMPAIIMGARHGWRAFLSVLICEFLWYLIFLIIYFSFFFQTQPQTSYYGGPVPLNSIQ